MSNIVILGTRPEAIKLAPIIKGIDCKVLNTGQHKELTNEVLELFDIEPDWDLELMEKSQSPEGYLSKAMPLIGDIIRSEKPERIWVQGDTATVLAGALSGFLNDVEVIHIEAGLRSYNLEHPYPEEGIRQMVSRISDYDFCPTISARDNLYSERTDGKAHVVGNTIVDALNMIELPEERVREKDYALVTMHRREVIGDPMKQIFEAFNEISKEIDIVFPCHPNPKIRELAEDVGVEIIEPLNYKDMLHHIRDAEFIMTDSGGIQEEAPSFDTPVLILRKHTERVEILDSGHGALVGWDKETIIDRADKLINDSDNYLNTRKKDNPFGDGKTVEKIKNILQI